MKERAALGPLRPRRIETRTLGSLRVHLHDDRLAIRQKIRF
jgi:hypothetical protein